MGTWMRTLGLVVIDNAPYSGNGVVGSVKRSILLSRVVQSKQLEDQGVEGNPTDVNLRTEPRIYQLYSTTV